MTGPLFCNSCKEEFDLLKDEETIEDSKYCPFCGESWTVFKNDWKREYPNHPQWHKRE